MYDHIWEIQWCITSVGNIITLINKMDKKSKIYQVVLSLVYNTNIKAVTSVRLRSSSILLQSSSGERFASHDDIFDDILILSLR